MKKSNNNNSINRNNAKLEVSAISKKQYPKSLPLGEVVLVGRSNVGKSSFINSILNRKNLARTSSKPGKTRQINFYNIDDMMYLVDLPGYGYSKMSIEEKIRSSEYIEEYLEDESDISLIIMLIDIRRDVTEDDKDMYNYILSKNIPFLILCNKADKITKSKIPERIESIKKDLGISYSPIYPYSSIDHNYVEKTWDIILTNIE